MGRRGPPPQPTALRVLNGNPAKRPLPRNEPKPRPLAPECPEWLDDEAQQEWLRVAQPLLELGLLTEVDGTALAAYCQAYATWKQATEILQRRGMTFGTPSGYKQQRPEVAIAQKAMSLIKGFAAEFGMTPSSRARIALGDKQEGSAGDDNPFDRSSAIP